jgi:hypothetical protein
MRKEKTRISKERNEKGEITNSKKFQIINREYVENLYSNKMEKSRRNGQISK